MSHLRTFWYHYNKPASKTAGKPKITIHYKGQCLLVDNLVIQVPTQGKINKRQPFFVVKGFCKNITIRENVAYVT